MGLKESGLRGSLRNVSVGIDAIPDIEGYLYNEGDLEEFWEVGFISDISEDDLEKRADNLFMEVSNDGSSAVGNWVMTEREIDLSNYSTIEIDWENTGADTSNNQSRLTLKDEIDQNAGDTLTEKTGTFDRTTDAIDVSGNNDQGFIGVRGAEATGSVEPVELSTYSIQIIE